MRTETITLYHFSELPTERAKERAREWWREGFDYTWSEESRQSIKAFCDHFGVRLTKWSVGPFSPISYDTDAQNHHFRGLKLKDFNRDHMPTGYCLDCDLWMTFFDEFNRTGDAKAAFDSALHQGFVAWRNDMEWQLSDECVDESLEVNEHEFTEDGRLA